MKVVFIGLEGYNSPCVRIRCYHFAKILSEHGIETEILSFNDHLAPDIKDTDMFALEDERRLTLTRKALWRLLREKNETIFYIQKILYHAVAPFLLYRFGRNKFVLDYDDWDIETCGLFINTLFNRIFFRYPDNLNILKYVASNALFCVGASRSLCDILSKFNENVFYIPTGVNNLKFKKLEKKKNEKIAFVWTGIVWGKWIYDNILFLLDCFSEVNRAYPDVMLKIVGSGQWMSKAKGIVSKTYKRYNIEFIDWIHPDQMPEFLSSVDIGLLPLIQADSLWFKSKSPTKLFEYMTMELPTVSSSVGEAKHVIKDGYDGFLANNREDFIGKMKELVENEDLRNEMGDRARKKIEAKYSLTSLGKQLFDVFQRDKIWR